MSDVLYTIVDGKKSNAELHQELLDNEEADKIIAEIAIDNAVSLGLTRAEAEALYYEKERL